MESMNTTEEEYITCMNRYLSVGKEVCKFLKRTDIPSDVRIKMINAMDRLMKYRKKIECSMAKDLCEHQERCSLCLKLQNEYNSLVYQVNQLMRLNVTNEDDIVLENYITVDVDPSETNVYILESDIYKLRMKHIGLLNAHIIQLPSDERCDYFFGN